MTRGQFRILMVLTVVAGFLGGAVSNLVLRGAPALAQEGEAVLQEVRARGFALVDEQGRGRAALRMTPKSGPGLVLYDEGGKPRANLSLRASGEPRLMLFDEAGEPRAVMGLEDGEIGLMLSDKAGEIRAVMGLLKGGPHLMLCDETGQALWWAP